MDRRSRRTDSIPIPIPLPSGSADGTRASQLRHSVQDTNGDTNFCVTAFVLVEAPAIANDLFISTDRGLHTAPIRIAERLLSTDPPAICDILQMLVALCGLGRSGLAQRSRGAGRHDNQRVRIPFRDSTVEAVLVVGPVAGKRTKRCLQLIKQRTHLRGVIDIIRRQHRGHDLAGIGVHGR